MTSTPAARPTTVCGTAVALLVVVFGVVTATNILLALTSAVWWPWLVAATCTTAMIGNQSRPAAVAPCPASADLTAAGRRASPGVGIRVRFPMDYEVFLLGRIKEHVDAGEDTDTAVRHGL